MILLLLANGFEEIEALTPVDVLRRAGLEVKTAGIGALTITGAHGIAVQADMRAEEVAAELIDALILPGGMPGTLNLDASEYTDIFINAVTANGGVIGAICAAPLILGRRGLLAGRSAVCYPGFEGELVGANIATDSHVVTDGNIVTAKGMGVALPFSLELVRILSGADTARRISEQIMEEKAYTEGE